MSTKKAGWLIDYNGDQFIPMTSAFEIFNRHGARTFGNAEANDDNLGAQNQFIFINNGVFAPSTQSIGTNEKTLMYLNNGIFSPSTTSVGSGTRPIYLNSGVLTACNTNIGANDNFIYINSDGNLVASDLNKGGSDTPIYFVNGVITEGNSSSYSLSRTTESNNITIALARGSSPAYSTISYNLGDNLVGDSTTNTISAGYQTAEYSSGLQISIGSISEDHLYVPYAGTSQYGVIKAETGTTDFDRNLASTKAYKLWIDPNGVGYVMVPWDDDTNDFHIPKYSNGLKIAIGAGVNDLYVPIFDGTQTGLVPEPGSGEDDGYFLSSNGSWEIPPYPTYTLPVATSSNLGGVKIGYKTSGTNYAVQLNSSDKMYVSVPWTDCNVTHSVVSTTQTHRSILVAGSEISSGGDVGGVQMHSSVYINTTSGCIYAPSLDITNGVTAASFNADSDIRLKENFRPFIHNNILDLPLYKFDYINGLKDRIGCIAQDLQKICPEIVHENEDGYLTIEESKIVYLLLDKMKEMQKEINELKGV